LDLILGLAAGIVLGAVAIWLYQRRQADAAFERGRASLEPEHAGLLERVAARDAEVDRLQDSVAELEASRDDTSENLMKEAARRAAADQVAERVPGLEAALEDARCVVQAKDRDNAELKAETARLAAELQAERAKLAEKLEVLNHAQEQLASAFRGLSAQALQANNQTFLDLAAQTLGKFQQGAQGDLDKRQQAIQELVAPVKVSLDKLDGRILEIEKAREGAYQALTTQVRSLIEGQGDLRRETSSLVKALRQPAARGRWGELQLRRVVEMAGMIEHCDFVEQATVAGEDGRLRPDMLVRLPGGRSIVVDAKTPLTAYLEAVEAQDDDVRRQRLVDHARQVRDHMTRLGRKSYQDQFDTTPELVVLFLPGEMFFSAALEQDPELIEFGVGEKVIPATPTTFIAMLRAIAYGWKQEALARNAQEISALGRELHERISVMAGHWGKVGRNLGEAVGAYNKAVASLESRVLVSARRFKELEAVPDGREIAQAEQVEALPRALQIPELEIADEVAAEVEAEAEAG
jgi:DNA recombination protein RmuC